MEKSNLKEASMEGLGTNRHLFEEFTLCPDLAGF